MTSRQRAGDRGAEDARRIGTAAGREIADARRASGLSQRAAAARAGVSASQFGRVERGQQPHPSVDLLCRCARSVGLALSARAFPDGSLVRDAASLALLSRLDRRLVEPLRSRREVSLPAPGDKRAWDERIYGHNGTRASVEAESHLQDVQATARKVELKSRDDPDAGIVILLVNKTAHNRRVLEAHREALRGQFPLDGAAILRSLRRGEIPSASGILVL